MPINMHDLTVTELTVPMGSTETWHHLPIAIKEPHCENRGGVDELNTLR